MTEARESAGLRVERSESGVLTLTLDNPANLNAMTSQVADGIREAVQAAGPETRCIVITGAGRAFCSGQDLRSDDRDLGVDVLLGKHYNPLISSIVEARQPVVAALNGVAAGIGASLALACDLRVASDEASIAFLFSKVGLASDGGASYFLPRLTSPAIASELMLLGGRLSAEEARGMGLLNRVWPSEEFNAEVERIGRDLANGPAEAFRLIKEQLRASRDNTLETQLSVEIAAQSVAVESAEYAEGRNAFLEKRAPDFRRASAGSSADLTASR